MDELHDYTIGCVTHTHTHTHTIEGPGGVGARGLRERERELMRGGCCRRIPPLFGRLLLVAGPERAGGLERKKPKRKQTSYFFKYLVDKTSKGGPCGDVHCTFPCSMPFPRGRVMRCRSGRWPPLFPTHPPPSTCILSPFFPLFGFSCSTLPVFVLEEWWKGGIPNTHQTAHTTHTRQTQ